MNKLTAEKCREQFEAWWQESQHNGNPPRFGWDHYRDGDTYSDDEFQTLWEAWKASRQALEIALPVLEQQEKGDDVWIEWGGGDNPATGKFVQVKFRDGMVDDEQPSASYRWYHDPNDCDIIAYRVIENDGREG